MMALTGCINNEMDTMNKMCSEKFNLNTCEMEKVEPSRCLYDISTSNNGKRHFVVYYDSLKCMSCEISKLNNWHKILMEIYDQKTETDALFIFATQKNMRHEVLESLSDSHFGHPVYIDTTGAFTRNNPHFPNDSRFHVFLTDENNNVIHAGNPLSNEKLQALFQKIINE